MSNRKYLTDEQIHIILEALNPDHYQVFVDLYLKETEDGPEGFYSAVVYIGDTAYIPVMVRDNLMIKKYKTRDAVLNCFGRDGGFTAQFRVFDYDDFLDHKPYYEMTDSEKKRWDRISENGSCPLI